MIAKASLLISQINSMIEELQTANNPVIDQKISQIKAINKTIKTMEKDNIAIPKELVRVRNKLTADLKQENNPEEVLLFLSDELAKCLKTIKINKTKLSPASSKIENRARIGRNVKRISRNEMKKELIGVLQEAGGSETLQKIQTKIEMKCKHKFSEADKEKLDTGIPRWIKTLQMLRTPLIQRKILKNNSPRGIWELTDKYLKKG